MFTKSFSVFSVVKIDRKANIAADLAKLAIRNILPYNWLTVIPDQFLSILYFDTVWAY